MLVAEMKRTNSSHIQGVGMYSGTMAWKTAGIVY